MSVENFGFWIWGGKSLNDITTPSSLLTYLKWRLPTSSKNISLKSLKMIKNYIDHHFVKTIVFTYHNVENHIESLKVLKWYLWHSDPEIHYFWSWSDLIYFQRSVIRQSDPLSSEMTNFDNKKQRIKIEKSKVEEDDKKFNTYISTRSAWNEKTNTFRLKKILSLKIKN